MEGGIGLTIEYFKWAQLPHNFKYLTLKWLRRPTIIQHQTNIDSTLVHQVYHSASNLKSVVFTGYVGQIRNS